MDLVVEEIGRRKVEVDSWQRRQGREREEGNRCGYVSHNHHGFAALSIRKWGLTYIRTLCLYKHLRKIRLVYL